MRRLIKILLVLMSSTTATAQQNTYWEEWSDRQIDSLKFEWKHNTNDTLRMAIARSLGFYYEENDRDSSLYFSGHELRLARKLGQRLWEGDACNQVAYVLTQVKDYPRAFQSFLEGISILEDKNTEDHVWLASRFAKGGDPHVARLTALGFIHQDIAFMYKAVGHIPDALVHFRQALKISKGINNYSTQCIVYTNLARIYFNENRLDSALIYGRLGLEYADKWGFQKFRGFPLCVIGDIYLKEGDFDQARKYLIASINHYSRINDNASGLTDAQISMARLFMALGKMDSSLRMASKGVKLLQPLNSPEELAKAYLVLSSIYQSKGRIDSAFKYQGLAMIENEKVLDLRKLAQFQTLGIDEQLRLKKLEREKIETQAQIRTFALLFGLGVFLLIGVLLYRNNKQKQRANALLQQQRDNIQSTLIQLRSTQSQLIQSEKMASLGELTAGIAHEIQNPLNFVNNFSEVNNELLDEMRKEIDNGNFEEVKSLAGNIIDNEEKITYHGKRADAIVKGMLQHSRSSSGVKEPTDINALADEYLRLAYHGLRAKDKSFNAGMKTEFDPTIGLVNVIPQDMGRVILNLITNAFYAVSEKKKQMPAGYVPTVTVKTGKRDGKIEISVIDNGNGIPGNVLAKIFQPFFTTKPTGRGTGLGLSMSYDIAKAHGGDLNVKTREGEFAEFIITLPSA